MGLGLYRAFQTYHPHLASPHGGEGLALLQCNHVMPIMTFMDEKEFGSIKGWFAGRLPDGWFSGAEVTVEDDQIVVVGSLSEKDLPATSSAEEKEGAAAGGREARGRDQALQPGRWRRRTLWRGSRDDRPLVAAPARPRLAIARAALIYVAGLLRPSP